MSQSAGDPGQASGRLYRYRHLWAVLLLAVMHFALVFHFASPKVIFSGKPIYDIDFSLHYYQVDRAQRAWEGDKKLWGYDPNMLAGHLSGALEDVSFKVVELFVIGLTKFGVSRVTAFNLFALLVHLLVPFLAYLAARLFGLERGHALIVVLLWSLLWFFDAFFHWAWYCGMISWGLASQLAIVLLGLIYRALEQRRWGYYLLAALLTLFLAAHHPFASLTLALPSLLLYLRQIRRRDYWMHGGVGLIVISAVVGTMLWLPTAWAFRHYVLTEDSFLRPTIDYLVYDFFDLLRDQLQGGPSVRTLFRVLVLGAAVYTAIEWYRKRDRRLLPIGTLVIFCLLLAYGGSHLHVTRVTQPYRQVMPMALAAALPAAIALRELFSLAHWRSLRRPTKFVVLLLGVLLLPRAVRTVLFFIPEAVRPLPADLRPSPERWQLRQVGFIEPQILSMRYHSQTPAADAILLWLKYHLQRNPGRVVVEDYMLGEYLAANDIPVLGGLLQRSFPHGDAHLFRLDFDGDLPGERLRRYLERYAVRYVVVSKLKPKLEWRKDLLKFVGLVDKVRIFETKIKPSYFMRGGGRLVKAQVNRIVIEDAVGPSIVLRFHWMETLACRPDCRVRRERVAEDRVGFIRIDNPPKRFEIYNAYRQSDQQAPRR